MGGGCKAGLGMRLCRELLFTEIDHSVYRIRLGMMERIHYKEESIFRSESQPF